MYCACSCAIFVTLKESLRFFYQLKKRKFNSRTNGSKRKILLKSAFSFDRVAPTSIWHEYVMNHLFQSNDRANAPNKTSLYVNISFRIINTRIVTRENRDYYESWRLVKYHKLHRIASKRAFTIIRMMY